MKSVVVTGATSGIGLATALDLAAHGFHVIATARTPEKAEKVTAMAAERGHRLSTVLLDVTDTLSCQDAMAEIDALTAGGPWALVNNAGVAHAGALEDVAEADARTVLEVNLLGSARMTRLVLPGMRRRGEGRIVQMSSAGGLTSIPLNGWYSASKHALEAVTDATRMETARSGIRISLIEPGFVDTPLLLGALSRLPAGSHYERAHAAARRLISTRKPIGPDVVARTVRRTLTARSPRRRYRIGWEATFAHLTRLMPSAATDRLLRAALHLDTN
jgi:NAD(P)-dependent dehydrogenase (short-subunit alcohol dehydrogenase family)